MSSTMPSSIARVLLGAGFTFFGLNGFFQFISPPPMPAEAAAMMEALRETGYFFPLLKTVETVCGLLLLSGRLVPLALTMLAPILINILAFHIFLDPMGIFPGALLALLELYVAWAYRDAFRDVLNPSAQPAQGTRRDTHQRPIAVHG